MAGLVTAGKNLLLDSGIGAFGYLSLHSADPGLTGTSELTGGSPAYARQSITWAAAASGTKSNGADITFQVPAGSTVSHVGYWSAASGGTFYGSRAVTEPESFSGQGTYTIATNDLDETVA